MDGLDAVFEDAEIADLSLAVVNRTSPEPLQRILEKLFDHQQVDVMEVDRDEETEDMVYLLDGEEVIAKSPLSAVADAILTVNSDLYITGTHTLEEVDPPEVIAGLTDVPFHLRGYPESHKEKLLLIVISRYIERLSFIHGGGKHRASFQRLSRIEDERGTRAVYEMLADTDIDVHVYGMPDWTPPPEFDLTMHGGWEGEFRHSWFVVHVPEDESLPHAALVALETRPRMWKGLWTYRTEKVREINRYIEAQL
ncbi:histidine kinase [Halorubrum vacuolatum]|uniref:Diguanylate Cyclase and Two-component system sensory domain-containing protein n=1 Tax=Halorubrum vacuolatum TaxID=63740 RepID=A0A238V6Z4_HALVU|nr:histidine kinase [Halorubrum vacuolatum]SNR30160.1 hypothetical protein SAMN06264855_10230 [Halorubrum vacuolatum]